MRYPRGWTKDRWRVTEPGNYQWHYAEHENGTMLWLEDPGGRGDNWSVKAGTSTRIRDSSHLASGLQNKSLAEGVVQQAMEDHPADPDRRRMQRYDRGGGSLSITGGL